MLNCVTGKRSDPESKWSGDIEYLQELCEVRCRRRPAGHLKAPPEDASRLSRYGVEPLRGNHRFGSIKIRDRQCRMHCDAERTVIVRCGTVVMGALLLQRRKLGVRVRDLGGAHGADHQNTEQCDHLKPDGWSLPHSELTEVTHKKLVLFV